MQTVVPLTQTRSRSRRLRGLASAALACVVLAALAAVAAPSAHADAAAKPSRGTAAARQVWLQDGSDGALPAATAAAAWSRRPNMVLSLGNCSGAHCIMVELVAVSACDGEVAVGAAVGGCAVPGPEGACTAQVKSWLTAYPDALRAALEHEVGHCLGLPHNTTDKRSIMSPALSLMDAPSGPDSGDLADVRALAW
jgi:hypothetical protein